ncbi:MAG TPA: hypothetical protein VFV94_19345 [Polyangiaceae bacterium]|nr:hypothetical protein [Polyangiaceae bacterium]
MKSTIVLFCASTLSLLAACGELRKPKGDGSMHGAGRSGAGGSGGVSGGAASGNAASGEGGMAADGSGGLAARGGASTAGLGGAAAAGRAGTTGLAGAMSAAGTSSAGGTPGLVVPDGCGLVNEHATSLYCSAELSCDDDHVTVSCTPQDSGAWLCSCSDGSTSTMFEFPETTGMPTCSITAKACRHPELLTGEETCVLDDEPTASDCVATDTCRREHLLDGVRLETKTEWKASCELLTDTAYAFCSCGAPSKIDYHLAGERFSAGCKFLDPLCRGAEPTPKSDWDCTTDFEDAGPGYGCHSGKTCVQAVALEDGSGLDFWQSYNLNCRSTDGHTRCTCEDITGREKLTLSIGISADDIGACQVTMDACSGVEALELADMPECTATKDETTVDYCERLLDCTEDGVTARTQVTALTRIGASCSHRENGKWLCNCKSASGLLDGIELEAGDATGACDAAMDQCPRFAQGLD